MPQASDFSLFTGFQNRRLGFPVGNRLVYLRQQLFLISGEGAPEPLLDHHIVETVIAQTFHIQKFQETPLFPQIFLLVSRSIASGLNFTVQR